MTHTEIWKEVKGYKAVYEASSLGRIRTIKTGRIKQSSPDTNGYPTVHLSKLNKGKTYAVHRVIADAFFGDRKGMYVNHKDGNRKNNKLENLELVTPSGNSLHIWKSGIRTRKLTKEQITTLKNRNLSGEPQWKLAEEVGVSQSLLSLVFRGKKIKGYVI